MHSPRGSFQSLVPGSGDWNIVCCPVTHNFQVALVSALHWLTFCRQDMPCQNVHINACYLNFLLNSLEVDLCLEDKASQLQS